MDGSERKVASSVEADSPVALRKRKKRQRFFLWVIALTIGAILIARLFSSGKIDFGVTDFRNWSPLWLTTSILSTIILGVIFQLRFYNLLRGNECDVSMRQVMAAGMKGWAVNAMTFGGFGGVTADLVRGGLLVNEGSKAGRLALLTLLDRGLGLWAMVTVGVTGICLILGKSGLSGGATGYIALFVLTVNLACCFAFLRRFFSFPVWIVFCQVIASALLLPLSGVRFGMAPWLACIFVFFGSLPIAWILIRLAGKFQMELSRFAVSYGLAFCVQLLFALILYQVGLATSESRASDWDYFLVAAPSGAVTSLIPLPGNGMGIAETVIAWGSEQGGMQIAGAKIYLLNRFVGAVSGVLVVAAIAGLHFFKQSQ